MRNILDAHGTRGLAEPLQAHCRHVSDFVNTDVPIVRQAHMSCRENTQHRKLRERGVQHHDGVQNKREEAECAYINIYL